MLKATNSNGACFDESSILVVLGVVLGLLLLDRLLIFRGLTHHDSFQFSSSCLVADVRNILSRGNCCDLKNGSTGLQGLVHLIRLGTLGLA